MFTISLRNLWEHKLRTFMLGGAIVTGVAFVVASLVFTDSLKAGFTDLFSQAFESIDIQVNPKVDEDDPLAALQFGLPRMDAAIGDTIASVDGVDSVITEVQGFLNIEQVEGEGLPGFGPPTIGFGWVPSQELFVIDEGVAPAESGEAAVGRSLLEERNLAIGDTIRMSGTGALEEFEIVGVIRFGAAEGASMGPTFVAFTFEQARALFEMEGLATAFGVKVEDDVDLDAVVDAMNAVLPDDVEAVSARTAAEAQAADLQEGISFFNTFLLVFAGISLVVGAFVVYNAFRVVVAQRTRELGLLRVLGSTRGELLRMVLIEAVLIGVLASVTGVAIGVAVAIGIRALLELIGSGSLPDSGLVVTLNSISTGIIVGTVTAALSALIPAVRATRISPMEALRDQMEVRRARPWWLWIGLLITLGSVGAVIAATMQATDVAGAISGNTDPVSLAGVAAFGLFLGFFLLARAMARPVIGLIGRPARALTSTLARENARRTPRRTATTAASLMIGLGLVATVAILSTSVEDTIIEAVENSFSADIIIQPGGFNPLAGMSDEIYPKVLETEGVAQASRLNILPAIFPNGDPNLLVGVEPENIALAISFEDVEGEWADLVGPTVAVQRIEADTAGLALGDQVDFELSSGNVTLTIVAIFDLQGDLSDGQNYYANYHWLREVDPLVPDYTVMVRLDDDADAEAVTEDLNTMLDDYGGATAAGVESLVEQVRAPLAALTGMIAGLLFMSVLVAVVGIVLTLYLAVHERTREIGLLRAIGMTRQQVARTIRWESVFIALYGAFLGLTIGIFLGWGLTITIIGDGAALAIPWAWVVLGFIGSALAGVLAAVVPANQATKLDILEAISYE